jgi:hypothetical protein
VIDPDGYDLVFTDDKRIPRAARSLPPHLGSDFDGDFGAEIGVVGAINFTQPPLANFGDSKGPPIIAALLRALSAPVRWSS